jgi:hypothetical protein
MCHHSKTLTFRKKSGTGVGQKYARITSIIEEIILLIKNYVIKENTTVMKYALSNQLLVMQSGTGAG